MKIDASPGVALDANEKPCCARHYIPADDSVTVDLLMNDLIDIKKGVGREFHTFNSSSFKKKINHFVEVPTGTSAPATRVLTKLVSSTL